MTLSIISVNYHCEELLYECIKAVYQDLKIDFEYIVVDNNSNGDFAKIEKDFPKVKIIYAESNKGFGSACNEGAKSAVGDLLLFLNPDTKVFAGSIQNMSDIFQKYRTIGICGGCLVNQHHQVQKFQFGDLPTFWGILTKQSDKKWNVPPKDLVLCGWVSGGSMMISRKVWDVVGGFDERFFMYFEDIDLCRRVSEAGYKVMWNQKAKIFHKEGGTQKNFKNMKKRYYTGQRVYIDKYEGKIKSAILGLFHKILLWRL
jgi:GT2 family glycosyltransferase